MVKAIVGGTITAKELLWRKLYAGSSGSQKRMSPREARRKAARAAAKRAKKGEK